MKTRQPDPIVAEVRAIRQAYAARFGYDVEAIFRDIRARQEASGHEYVRLPDYSGRPTPEEIASSTSSVPPEDAIVTNLPDGRIAVQGYDDEADSHGWYLPDEDGWPDYDRPVDPDTGARPPG